METGMTVAKLLEARRIFAARRVDLDGESWHMVVSRRQIICSFKGKQKRYAKWKLFLSERKQRREAFRRVRSNPESFPLVHGSVAYSIGCHRHA